MRNPPAKPDERHAVVASFLAMRRDNPQLTASAAGPLFGVPPSTMRGWVRHAGQASSTPLGELTVNGPTVPSDESLDDLVARKKKAMQRAKVHDEWAKLIPVDVASDRPIGLTLVGDPHVDDDHCDIEALERDLTTVGRTKGMFAGHVGDLTNNWVGRLARLYANQSTTFGDGIRLTEWMLNLCPNLFVVAGNHDCWGKGMDLLRWVVKHGSNGPLQAHGARLELRWPDGKTMRLHARHDFPGKSQFSDTHGMKRELLWGHRDDILVAGHTHVDEARVEPSVDGGVHWLFRVSGYKVIDDFAKERNFRPKRLAPSVTVVLDPWQPVPAERIKPFWDVQTAADYLTWARKRT